jgi:soluble epoxide hydrolase/lipid-phosphate phosphatase
MAVDMSRHEFTTRDGRTTTSYLEAGPGDGPLLIFVHGWAAIAETWTFQINTFAGLGFRVVAPDMPGYGRSTKTREMGDYTLQKLVAGLVALLKHLERSEAVWVGHGWGAAVVWALLAHHPETCVGVANMGLPYRTQELGVEELVKYANRDLYPEAEYPHAQWADQVLYTREIDKMARHLESDVDQTLKLVYRCLDPVDRDKPASTAKAVEEDDTNKGPPSPASPAPLAETCLDEPLHAKLVEAFTEGGFWAPSACYLNGEVNRQWTEDWSINEGVVSVPTLFIEALYDPLAGTYNSRLKEPMQSFCRRLTEVSIEAGPWLPLEAPEQVNAALARWIATVLPSAWPYARKTPLKRDE